jgi:uncharacterized protein YcfJ
MVLCEEMLLMILLDVGCEDIVGDIVGDVVGDIVGDVVGDIVGGIVGGIVGDRVQGSFCCSLYVCMLGQHQNILQLVQICPFPGYFCAV